MGSPRALLWWWCATALALDGDLDGDVAAYFAAKPFLGSARHCSPVAQGTCIYLDPEGGIVHASDMHRLGHAGKGKQMLFDAMLRGAATALEAAGGLPGRWLSFNMVYTAAGPTGGARRRKFPTLAIGKREPDQPGLLVPNPFFVSPEWWRAHAERARERAASRPWSERMNRVLFRGNCGPGAGARLELLALKARLGDRLDVGFTGVDGYGSLPECVAALEKKFGVAAAAPVDAAPHVPQTNYSNYRYLLHMPGSATGSYSRNLQYLWSHGAIVLVWNHSAVEWYYRHLVDGQHFVRVDAETFADRLEALDADPEKRETLLRGAAAFHDAHLAADVLVARWRVVLAAIDAAQDRGKDPVPPENACTCEPRLKGAYAACDQCAVTRMSGERLAHHIGILQRPKKRAAAGA